MSGEESSAGAKPSVWLRVLVGAGLLAGPFLTMVDESVVNVAIPDISGDLHSPLSTVQWVSSAYLLALAVGLAATAYLAKRFGTIRAYLAGLIGFTVASGLCAAAPTINLLIAARVLQGTLGAPLLPLAMNMLLGGEEVGGRSRGRMLAAGAIPLFAAPAIGPTVGGLLIHLWGWPLIFLINVPFGFIGVFGVLCIPRSWGGEPDPATRFDLAGFLMLGVGLALSIYGASQGPQHGWTAPSSWPYWSAGLILVAAYVAWALRREQPVVNVRLLRRLQPALYLFLAVLAAVVLFVTIFLMPVFIQELQGYSAVVAGLALVPQALAIGVSTIPGNWLPAKVGMRVTVAMGWAALTATTGALLAVGVSTPVWVIALILCGRGMGVGLVIQPLLIALIGSLPSEEVPDGNTLFNVAQRLGGSFGIPLLATLFGLRVSQHVEQAL